MQRKGQLLIKNAKAIIFDFDGVIIDSIPSWHKSKQEFLQKYNVPILLPFNVLGMGTKDILHKIKERYHLKPSIPELFTEWTDLAYTELTKANNSFIIPESEIFLKKVFETKPLGIATGGFTKTIVEEILQKNHLHTYFKAIVSSDTLAHGKPYPDVFLFTAKVLNTDPKKTLVVEDAPNGVIAAKRAGMKVIAVNKDVAIQKDLYEAGADVILSELIFQ